VVESNRASGQLAELDLDPRAHVVALFDVLAALERAAGSGTEEPSLDCSLSQQTFAKRPLPLFRSRRMTLTRCGSREF